MRDDDEAFQEMASRLADLLPRLNERDRRLALATELNSALGAILGGQSGMDCSRNVITNPIG